VLASSVPHPFFWCFQVSGFLKNLFPKTLFAEPSFATDVPTALREAVRKAEAAMLKSNYQVMPGSLVEGSLERIKDPR
jgi:hypothetical protein